MAAYATVDDVIPRLGGRVLTATSKPSTADVTAWLDEGSVLLDAALQAGGLPAPYTEAAAVTVLKAWLCEYGIGLIERAHTEGLGAGTEAKGDLVDKFYARLADIRRDPSYFGALLGAGDAPTSSSRLRASNRDGTLAAEFTREMDL